MSLANFPAWYSRLGMNTPKPERRSGRRITARVPVSIRSPQESALTGYTRDVSTSGIFLYADSKIELGSELEFVLILPPELTEGEKRWVCCQATVVRVGQPEAGKSFGLAANIRNMQVLPEILG